MSSLMGRPSGYKIGSTLWCTHGALLINRKFLGCLLGQAVLVNKWDILEEVAAVAFEL